MRNHLQHLLLLLLVACAVVACKPRRPAGLISEGKMQAILYDYHLAQSIAEQSAEDVERERYMLVQSVFKKHGVTEAEFDSSMVFYNTNPKILGRIYDRLSQRFEAESKALGLGLTETEIYASYSQYGDTANVWMGQSIMFIRNDGLNNVMTLNMQCDTTFRAGDSFRLNFMANFLTPARQLGFAFLTVRYDNDSTLTQLRRLGGNYETSMELKPDEKLADHRPKSISITFFHQPDENSAPGYMILTRPSLLRMHDTTRPATPVKVESPEEIARRADSLRLDSLRLDSLRLDNERRDSAHTRMSPEEFRESKPVEHRINVVKERPIIRRTNPSGRSNSPSGRNNSLSGRNNPGGGGSSPSSRNGTLR